MALGIGATTAVFSVLRGVLIAPLPYRDPGGIVLFRADLPGMTQTPRLTSMEFAALRAHAELFDQVAAAVISEGTLRTASVTTPISAAAVSENFLDALGVPPALGRAVGPAGGSGRRSINISYEIWQRLFQGDPAIVGATIDINGIPSIVAGVLPRGFRMYLGAGVTIPTQVDVLYFRGRGYDDDPFRGNVVIARLRRGATLGTARAVVDTVAKTLVADHPDRYRTGPVRLSLAPLDDEVVSEVKPALLAAAGAVLLVLIVTCANLMNLLLARASARTQELAVRVSIGASRADIIRQLVAEGLVVGAIGAAIGWTLAHWGVNALVALAPSALPRREAIVLDGGIALFAIVVAMSCAIAVSLVPGWQAARADIARAGNARTSSTGGATRGVLVAAQLAFSVMLLVGAGLMARAFVNLRSVPLGFDPRGAAAMYITLAHEPWGTGTLDEARLRRRYFYEALIDQARDLPGVHRVGIGLPVPLSGATMSQRVSLGPGTPERETDGFVAMAGYLEALDVPLIAGRYFTRADDRQPMVIVDDRLARELWPGESPIGRRLMIVRTVDTPLWSEVVGVAAHVQARGPREAGPPQVWLSYPIRPYAHLHLVVRADDPIDATSRIGEVVQQLGAGRPVRDIRRLGDLAAEASADTRFALFVLGVLAALAVILAAVGVYGVMAYAMARRTRELAVRLALGASPRRLVARVLGDGAIWTILGLGGGLAGASLLARQLESLLFEVDARDAVTFAGVAAFLAVVTLAASAIPAYRAARIDPMLALRAD
jgi:predicted permease